MKLSAPSPMPASHTQECVTLYTEVCCYSSVTLGVRL
uniref:Uncharacterized protein n=1 Tax=Anguilla anguilla TaxID=7936 RepID=A0A0E9R5U2_ANGAN